MNTGQRNFAQCVEVLRKACVSRGEADEEFFCSTVLRKCNLLLRDVLRACQFESFEFFVCATPYIHSATLDTLPTSANSRYYYATPNVGFLVDSHQSPYYPSIIMEKSLNGGYLPSFHLFAHPSR